MREMNQTSIWFATLRRFFLIRTKREAHVVLLVMPTIGHVR